jgi:hypothetical protein
MSERPRELGHRARLAVGHHGPTGRGELVEIDPVELAAVGPEYPLAQHGVVAGAPGEDVLGGEEVDGAAHEVCPHHPSLDQQVREDRRVERTQPRPEPDERLLRFLRLEPAEVRDGVGHRNVGAIEQQLPGQRGAVERAVIENGGGHETTIAGKAVRI